MAADIHIYKRVKNDIGRVYCNEKNYFNVNVCISYYLID